MMEAILPKLFCINPQVLRFNSVVHDHEHLCPIHVVTFTLISNLATDYIQKRRGEPGLFSFEYNMSPKLISK